MNRLKEQFITMQHLAGGLLQRKKLRNADVTLVVGVAFALEDGTGVRGHGAEDITQPLTGNR